MPQPYPGQQWKHGWIPLTGAAEVAKNHGNKPKPRSGVGTVKKSAAKAKGKAGAPGGDIPKVTWPANKKAAKRTAKGSPPKTGLGMLGAARHYDDAEGVEWANKHMPLPSMTAGERTTLRAYSGRKYGPINRQLRAGKVTDEQIQGYIDTLDGLFDRTSPHPAVVAHRGVDSFDGFAEFLGADVDDPESMHNLVGKSFREAGYMSTSVGRQTQFAGDIQLMIRVPEDYPALNMMAESATGAREREVILRRNAHYVVHAAYKRGDYWHIEAEIVPDDWTPPPGWAPNPYGDGDRQ